VESRLENIDLSFDDGINFRDVIRKFYVVEPGATVPSKIPV